MASSRGKALGIGGAVLLLAGGLVAKWEPGQDRGAPYFDKIGSVWTVCDGHTGNVNPKHHYSDAECDALREQDLAEANSHVRRCIPVPMLPQIEGALTDAAFNIGPKVVCGSTLQRKALANDWPGACAELDRWNRGGGRVVSGLVKRRYDDRKLCEGRQLWEGL